jgi:hypothetical protein
VNTKGVGERSVSRVHSVSSVKASDEVWLMETLTRCLSCVREWGEPTFEEHGL